MAILVPKGETCANCKGPLPQECDNHRMSKWQRRRLFFCCNECRNEQWRKVKGTGLE